MRADQVPGTDPVPDEEDIAAEIAAEEAAAAAVEEDAEDEDDGDGDALDEDADAARYDPDRRHPLSDLPPPADNVQIGHVFETGLGEPAKSGDDSVLTLGEPVKVVVAFSNKGRLPYHVWGVTGSLNHHNRYSVFVQNFSYTMLNRSIGVGGELSFSYTFIPNERLDVRPFQLALTMFYEAQSTSGSALRGHSTTFFNSSITTKPGPHTMSNGLFMLFFSMAVAAAVGAWFAWKTWSEKAKKDQASEASASETSKSEWLEDHHLMSGGGRARQRSTTKRS